MLEALAARGAGTAGVTSADSVSSAVAELPFAQRLFTDALIDADSCSGHAALLAEVSVPSGFRGGRLMKQSDKLIRELHVIWSTHHDAES